ncbi:TPA: hypothetical protein EYH33_03330 [Candidatus Bipolaricaulota bacterium]|nr:hypothetical protein [Candidatus Bipolaricaulota bacterium]
MGRILALAAGGLLVAASLGWGQPVSGPESVHLAASPARGQAPALEPAGYLPAWRLVLQRLFRTGLRRLLRDWIKKLRRGRGLLAGPLAGALAALIGPCGRLWCVLG